MSVPQFTLPTLSSLSEKLLWALGFVIRHSFFSLSPYYTEFVGWDENIS